VDDSVVKVSLVLSDAPSKILIQFQKKKFNFRGKYVAAIATTAEALETAKYFPQDTTYKVSNKVILQR